MNRKVFLAIAVFLTFTTGVAQAQFYDAKSMIVGITATDDIYSRSPGKMFSNPVVDRFEVTTGSNGRIDPEATRWNLERDRVGKKVLDLLFERNKGRLSEDLLRQRAWENVQLTDLERAQYGVYSPELILKEDILPILESNYILITSDYSTGFFKVRERKSWVVYHVDINQATWDEVNKYWNDLNAYDSISVGISFVASGTCKSDDFDILSGDLLRSVSKKVPALAVRGQIIEKNPYTALIENSSVFKGERMAIYTQEQGANGKLASTRIGYARTKFREGTDGHVNMFNINGKKGDPKKGDMAVLSPVSPIVHNFYYQTSKSRNLLGYTLGLSIFDVGTHYCSIDFDFRAGCLKNHSTALYPLSNGDLSRSPVYGSIGTGATYGWMPVAGISLDLYWLVMGEFWYASTFQSNEPWYDIAVRFPIGLRAGFTAAYPVRFIAGVEWQGLEILGLTPQRRDVLTARGWDRVPLSFVFGLRYAF